jgi:hypothetical protein
MNEFLNKRKRLDNIKNPTAQTPTWKINVRGSEYPLRVYNQLRLGC